MSVIGDHTVKILLQITKQTQCHECSKMHPSAPPQPRQCRGQVDRSPALPPPDLSCSAPKEGGRQLSPEITRKQVRSGQLWVCSQPLQRQEPAQLPPPPPLCSQEIGVQFLPGHIQAFSNSLPLNLAFSTCRNTCCEGGGGVGERMPIDAQAKDPERVCFSPRVLWGLCSALAGTLLPHLASSQLSDLSSDTHPLQRLSEPPFPLMVS